MNILQKRNGQSLEIVHTRLICHYQAIHRQIFTSKAKSKALTEGKDAIFPPVSLSKTAFHATQAAKGEQNVKYFKATTKKTPFNIKKMLAQTHRQRHLKPYPIHTQYNPNTEGLPETHSAPLRRTKKELNPCPQILSQDRNNNQKNQKQNISTSVIIVCIQQPKKSFLKARKNTGLVANFTNYAGHHHMRTEGARSFVAKQKKESPLKFSSISAWSTSQSDQE